MFFVHKTSGINVAQRILIRPKIACLRLYGNIYRYFIGYSVFVFHYAAEGTRHRPGRRKIASKTIQEGGI